MNSDNNNNQGGVTEIKLVLSVDPAKNSGWSLLSPSARDEQQVLLYGNLKNTCGDAIKEVLEHCISFAKNEGLVEDASEIVVVIEDQFLHSKTKNWKNQFVKNGEEEGYANPDSMKKVARIAGAWEGVCESVGLKTIRYIFPHSWQTKVLAISGIKRMKRNELKKLAQDFVEQVFKIACTQDEADAILIGRYAVVALRMGTLL